MAILQNRRFGDLLKDFSFYLLSCFDINKSVLVIVWSGVDNMLAKAHLKFIRDLYFFCLNFLNVANYSESGNYSTLC